MRQHAMEVLFKHKFLILLPLVLIAPIAVLLARRTPAPKWRVTAGIWVDQYRPLFIDDRLGATPAINQAQLLNDFIHTRGFAIAVLKETRLAPQLATPASEDAALTQLGRAVAVAPSGNSFMSVSVTMNDPDLAFEIMQGMLDNFQASLAAQRSAQASAALTINTDATKQAQDALTKAQNDLSAYLTAHPQLTSKSVDSTLSPLERDPNFAKLVDQLAAAQQSLDGLQKQQGQLQQDAAAGQAGVPFTLTVVDQPQRPQLPVPTKRVDIYKLPAIALTLGLLLSLVAAVFLVLTDRTARGSYDFAGALAVPVLGEIGELRGFRWPFKRRAHALRARRWLWRRKTHDVVRLRLVAPACTIVRRNGDI
ncbi:MAG TPA: hypothetical protein VKV26_12300 [Dehalococcoidia bacterium]|nr:hypothetical protein [Dehalococcoidia bacterium]